MTKTYHFTNCEDAYGKLGDADETTVYDKPAAFKSILNDMSGVWYSNSVGIGRLDGYRIGKWSDFDSLMVKTGKMSLFPNVTTPYQTYTGQSGSSTPGNDDYFIFYDDTVFGQSDDGTGGNGGWDEVVTRYIGIVRAVNIFNGDKNRGSIIIEYLKGCAPKWLDQWPESSNGKRPFFGLYYRI